MSPCNLGGTPQETSVIADLDKLLDRRQFHPFAIFMERGQRYWVTGRSRVEIGRYGIVLLEQNSVSFRLRRNSISSNEDQQPARLPQPSRLELPENQHNDEPPTND